MRGAKTVILLMGPTASGKTGVAIELSNELPVDIISVDSGMIYRGLDIGTAKPTLEEQKKAPHHLIDICNPEEIYSAAKFREDALCCISQAFEKKRIPLLVGGTMLYFRVLCHGISDMPDADLAIREKIKEQARALGWPALHALLRSFDPISADQIHPNDTQRIERALELYYSTGKTRAQLWGKKEEALPFDVLPLIMAPGDRSVLHQRIENRFHQMIERGFLSEAESLFQRKNMHMDLPSMRAVGYRQAWRYFLGELSREEMIERAIYATRQLARRQLTWLRSWSGAIWLDSQEKEDIVSQIVSCLGVARSG